MQRVPPTKSAAQEPPSSTGKKKPKATFRRAVEPKTAFDIKYRKRNFAAFLASRPGLTEKSFFAARGFFGVWQPNVEKKFYLGVWAIPAYRALPDGKCYASAWVMYMRDGTKFGGKDEPKCRTFKRNKDDLRGGDGLIIVGDLKRLANAERVWLCEGPSDALALDAKLPENEIAVAVSNGAETFSKEAAALCEGKAVNIIFDADNTGERGRLHAAKVLLDAVAEIVKQVRLPYEIAEKGGKDLRDWINEGHTLDDLVALAEKAEPVRPDEAAKVLTDMALNVMPNEKEDDAFRLARVYLKPHETKDGPRLRYWNSEMLRWREGCYVSVPDADFRADLSKSIKREFNMLNRMELMSGGNNEGEPPQCKNVTTRLLGDVVNAVRSLCIVGSDVERPAWIDDIGEPMKGTFPANELLNCAGKLVHVPSLAFGADDCVIDATPAFFTPTMLDCEFQPDAPAPSEWLRFLDQLFPNDKESIELLQQWFGYCLLPRMEQQKILMLVGPPRSGKGTIAHILEHLIGKDNIAAPTLASLGERFGLQPLLGKSLAVISDARLSGRNDIAQIVENLLRITGEDPTTVDRKNRPPLSTHLGVRMMILTNEVPDLRDASGAAASRFMLLRLRQSFLGREDHGLKERLLKERPGMLNWALVGERSLRRKGSFTVPESSRSTVEELQNLTSPVAAFINEFYVERTGGEVEIGEAFRRWRDWCERTGVYPGDRPHFSRNVCAAFPGVDSRQVRRDGERRRWFTGLMDRSESIVADEVDDDA
jgi:putative DNA primase/helicase